MRTGQIGVCIEPGPGIGLLVAEAQGSVAYHTLVAASETEAISVEPGGVRLRPIDHFGKTVWSDIAYEEGQAEAVVAWAMKRLGRPYGYLDLLIIGAHLRLGWKVPNWLGGYLSSDRRYICSELAACALWYGAGLKPFDYEWPGLVKPDDWLRWFAKSGWYVKKVAA